MRIGIIDCGTNTFNLLIVEVSGSSFKKIYGNRIPVKLGEGAINNGYIAEKPYERGISAMSEYRTCLKKYDVTRVLAFATSAIRDASNGRAFAEQVFRECDIEIQIIDGFREADLIYKGCRKALPLHTQGSLIMDIGGGSTEFILCSSNEVIWKKSYNLGAARLLEKFSPSDPINMFELAAIQNYLDKELESLADVLTKKPAFELVGSSGAFDSIIEMIHGELQGEALSEHKTGYSIDLHQYKWISTLIKRSTLEQRKQVKGLTPMRLDMIVISCLLIDYILNKFPIKQFRVSTYSLKEGALFDYLEQTD